MALEPAVLGLGVALESATMAGRHPSEGRLRPLFGFDRRLLVKAHFALYPARHARCPPVEVFLNWIHAEATRTMQEAV